MTAQITTAQAEQLTRKHTAYKTFAEMTAPGTNTPTLKTRPSMSAKDRIEVARLADAYDDAMKAAGDSRRAWRG